MNTSNHVQIRKSKFNLVVSLPDCVAIYNTLQDSITLVKSHPSELRKTELDLLHKQGVLVNQGIDENMVFRCRAGRQKFNSSRLHLFLTITGKCNCDCQYCFAKGCFPNHSMNLEDVDIVLGFLSRELRSRSFKEIAVDLFGGEPLLCESIYLQVMRGVSVIAAQLGIVPSFQFYTNGTIRPQNGFATFSEFQAVKFLITLDGLRETHNMLRPLIGNGSSYDLILRNLQEIREIGQQAIIRINYGKRNYKEVPLLLDELVRQGLTCFPIEFYPIQSMSKGSAEFENSVSCSDLQKIVGFLWEAATERGILIATRPVSANCYCSAFTDTMFVIDPDLGNH